MSSVKLAVLFLVVFCVSFQNAADLQVGTSLNGQLAYSENVKLSSIPFSTRVKNVFYNDNSTRIIKVSSLTRQAEAKTQTFVPFTHIVHHLRLSTREEIETRFMA